MNVDEPLPLILRKKTCPFCRATIRSRPLPLFILKSLLSVLADTIQSLGPGAGPIFGIRAHFEFGRRIYFPTGTCSDVEARRRRKSRR